MSKKSKPTISTHRKELIKLIEKAARTTSTWNVFNDFITVSALSISNSSDSFHIANSEKVWNEREQRYLKIINKYDENTRPLFPQMFNELVSELQDASTSHYTDVLGEIFGEMGFHDKWKGQFFTPQHVSDLMAMMTIDSETTAKAIKERGFITINEPCCGAGSLIIGAINAMREIKLNPSKQMIVVANDIDERCTFSLWRSCRDYPTKYFINADLWRTLVYSCIHLRWLDLEIQSRFLSRIHQNKRSSSSADDRRQPQ